MPSWRQVPHGQQRCGGVRPTGCCAHCDGRGGNAAMRCSRTDELPLDLRGSSCTAECCVMTRAAAIAAARRGWAVFPCRPGDKRPAIDRWEERASADPTHIETAWRDRYPRANVGIAAGPSGLVVVDLDTSEHGAQLLH